MDWCEPFVLFVVQPLRQCPPQAVAAAVKRLWASDEERLLETTEAILRQYCAPIIEALGPSLRDTLEREDSGGSPLHGWRCLAQPFWWFPLSSLRHWKETVHALDRAGLEPTRPIVLESSRMSTTLLHLQANAASELMDNQHTVPGEAFLEQMLVLAEMGADVRSLDSEGRSVRELFRNPARADQWERMAHSLQASWAARDALMQTLADHE